MISHLVLFTPKRDLSADDSRLFAQSIVETFRQVGSLDRATVGRAVDIDAGYQRNFGDKTYEFAAVLEFLDREALLGYLQHQKHQALGRRFWESCESTVVVEVDGADALSVDIVELLAKQPNPD